MGAVVQFWFEFASTYSYLSAMRIEEAAAKKGVAIDWQPFLLGPIFADQGWATSPFNLYPAKGRYMWRDIGRICARRNLPFQRPEPFPQNSLKAARLTLTIEPCNRAAFVRAVYSAQFGEGRDISDPEVLRACLADAGLPPDLLDRTQAPEVKSALFDQTDRARALGIFGAPSFLVGEELFWGDDRLDEAISYAARV